jgi:hypothetical protein
MKRKIIIVACVFTCMVFSSFQKEQSIKSYLNNSNQLSIVKNKDLQSFNIDSKKLDANSISAWFRNNGNFNRDPATGNGGFYWPGGSDNFLRFTSGLWVGCIKGNDTLNAIAEYSYDFKNGYVDNNGNPQGENDPSYRIYTISRGDSTSPDYLNWPASQGAYITPEGKPYSLGTQTMFYSYTDAYQHESGSTSDSSLKIQILQSNWSYTNTGLQDVIFTEFKIINRSQSTWTNTFISFWTADVIGSDGDDAIGCDTIRKLGFTYNRETTDPNYGADPPSVGTTLLRSPYIFTGNNNDTIKFYDPPSSQKLKIKTGYKFTGLNVFNYWNNSAPEPADPRNYREIYRVMKGLWRLGNNWVIPGTAQQTTFAYSGDPVTGTGWVMYSGSHRIFLMSCGPFTMNSNDTQSVIFAQVVARGTSNLNSITKLRELTDHVKRIYDQNFQSVLAVNNVSSEIPWRFELKQNYPNPFNPVTNLEFGISNLGFVSLKVYDALGKEVKTLVNEMKSPGIYRVDFDGSALSSGIYFYKLSTGSFSETKRMILLK